MDHIKKAVARLDGNDGDIATAFLISEEYMLTARHTFISNPDKATYKICFPNYSSEKTYTIDEIYFEEDIDIENLANDIAIIKLNEPIGGIQPLIIEFSEIKVDEKWTSYGFPGANRSIGERFVGTINDILKKRPEVKYDLNLNCDIPKVIDAQYGIGGASGAPIICNNKVVAIFSNDNTGAIIGAASLKRSRRLIETYVDISKTKIVDSPLEKAIKEAVSTTESFIEGFPEEVHDFLRNELNKLKEEFLANINEIKVFLENSKYPIAKEETLVNGIEETLEIILMVRSMYGNIHILVEDDFANLRVVSDENLHISFVYALERNKAMPEILLKMHNQMVHKSAAQIMIKCGMPIPPYPIIFDNCSSSRRHNLCKVCGQSFRFEGILRSYIETEDDALIKGIEENNFALLNKVKIICGECVRKVRDDVENSDELKRKVAEKVYG
ncbi:ABC-three component system protein [Bacillus sp. TH12]|uniref:ABC-three component system protein n=1 Tax=Bacillus sp. TH12 TaxID=2796378 RepID=UPI001911C179|nr:ABC-three component system protein [Bacillus sp. TH12]MBK5503248.1 trypsin-like peptidase domain-containing protein [Bacillus sp. TH12]